MAAPGELKHWRLETDGDGLAWLRFDQAGARANTLGRDTLGELEAALEALAAEPPRGLVLRSDKAGGFIAGADVRAFTTLRGRHDALAAIRQGQAIIGRLEALRFPTVALIHGHCLGGGLELALACRHRIAEHEATLGLPEVRLGIHPGFGGTVRLPRVVGAPRALELMLSGRNVRGREAASLGLVDYALPARQLLPAARALALRPRPRRRPGLWTRAAASAPARPLVAWALRRHMAERADPKHYPAPYALLDIWRRHGGNERGLMRAEGESVADLITSPTARNLTHVFFLRERLRGLGRARPEEPAPRHVHVVGAGAMGGEIAAWCALQGLTASLEDTSRDAVAASVRRAAALFERRLREPRRVRAAMDRLLPDEDGAGARHADVVIEAIVEDLDAKRELFVRLGRRARADALLATNTSSLPIESIGEALGQRRRRLVGLHFFNPVTRMPLVEVVGAGAVQDKHMARAHAFVAAVDKLPLPVRSHPGFLVNRVLTPYLAEAVRLYDEGISPARIDGAAVHFGMPMGPLLLADTVGLDVCLAVAEVLARELGAEVPERLRSLVQAGRHGIKTGQGFYDHRGRRKPVDDDYRGIAEVAERLMLPLVNEAMACVREGVVEDAALADAGLVFGAGFAPFRGGPLRYAESEGRRRIAERLERLRARHGARFTPDPGWLEGA